jgi:hypothetical protein
MINFAFLWEGYINIPSAGVYTFETISDDGSKLYFNTSYSFGATPLVNNDGLHASRSATGNVSIASAGKYPIAISYFEKDGGETMQVYWTGPGIPRQPIPDAAFTINNAPIAALGNILNTAAEQPADKARSNIAKAGMEIIKVYPNPFNDRFNIDFYNTAASNDISIGVYDVKRKIGLYLSCWKHRGR